MSLSLEAVGASSVACAGIEEKFIEIAGCRVRYLTGGRGPALVLIHGLLAYSFSWRFNLEALAQRATVFAIDLPGMGFSQRLPNPEPGLTPSARTILDFMKALGISSATLLGSSHGGGAVILAAPLAAENGIKIEKMILVSPVNPWSLQGTRVTDLLATRWGAAIFRPLSRCLTPLHGYFLRRLYGNPRQATRETIEGYSRGIRIAGTMEHCLARVKHWRQDLVAIEQALPRCPEVPVLLIWGDCDGAVYSSSAKTLLKNFPRGELVMMRGAGHVPYEEEPEEFNRIVLDFLART
jgi:pimeloyl-ACP methyl ester carboxylesterase